MIYLICLIVKKKRGEKWEGVKDEFDFDNIKCPNFLKEDTPPYTGSCLL